MFYRFHCRINAKCRLIKPTMLVVDRPKGSYDVKPRSILNQNAVYSSSLSSKISLSYHNAGLVTSQQQYALASSTPFSSKLKQNFSNNSISKSISASPSVLSGFLGFHNTENTGVTLSSTPPPYEANTLQQILQPPMSLEVADSHSL